ncbi:MAG: DUF692 domain-containing protein [Lautropia sp.]|jgi:UPF0276 protein pputGB1_2003|uniref:DUF692 domain-containing protein n=1 Tax=Lautropia dentalis TaxID=2490857 RepID=A0A3R8LQ42_9BURK|nr:DUF692 domain-containing protein [Lautropia dentalis]RKW43731.1 MAG: DUF692 domain-containing protein [Lautropia sp.]RRN44200.1 DUF692 domain-containing protein [Lautropia dentalis]
MSTLRQGSREVRRLHRAGLGLRRSLLADTLQGLQRGELGEVAFFEVAPENWSRLGGRFSRDLSAISEFRPLACHGLSLNLGGSDGLDMQLLAEVKAFMRTYRIALYTEHLSWCGHEGHLYDLLPLPATHETVRHVATRIAQVQDFLGEQIGIENASYYAAPEGAEMDDATFVREVVKEAGCLLHLDVNNVYVNSQNHGFDPYEYTVQLPLERTCYIHVAGHHVEDDGLIIDTHGMPVIDPVWELLAFTYDRLSDAGLEPRDVPSCLERDFNFPPLAELVDEVGVIDRLQREASARRAAVQSAAAAKVPDAVPAQHLLRSPDAAQSRDMVLP